MRKLVRAGWHMACFTIPRDPRRAPPIRAYRLPPAARAQASRGADGRARARRGSGPGNAPARACGLGAGRARLESARLDARDSAQYVRERAAALAARGLVRRRAVRSGSLARARARD